MIILLILYYLSPIIITYFMLHYNLNPFITIILSILILVTLLLISLSFYKLINKKLFSNKNKNVNTNTNKKNDDEMV